MIVASFAWTQNFLRQLYALGHAYGLLGKTLIMKVTYDKQFVVGENLRNLSWSKKITDSICNKTIDVHKHLG